jgi:PDZ domain-containing protein
MVIVAVWAGRLIKIDYYTEAPGDAVPVQPMVAIDGAPEFEAQGSFMLLYIRRRDRISLLRYLQARLDPDMDVKKGDYSQPGQSPEDLDAGSTSDMEQAKIAASKLALERIGVQVTRLPGLVVTATIEGRPAHEVLRIGDVLLQADGTDLDSADTLASVIRDHETGESVAIRFERDGETRTVDIETESNGADEPAPIIGVFTNIRYEFPVGIAFEGEIERIGGPSAGLAMTLALIDELTPGELSGGGNVAVTGTIDIAGNVGNVGRVDLKAKAAAHRGATLMLVPTCHEPAEPSAYESAEVYELVEQFKRDCDAEVRRADDAIDTVIEVSTLDGALSALAENGGEALPDEFRRISWREVDRVGPRPPYDG